MHSVVHVRREKLLRLLSKSKDIVSTSRPLDQLALHPYMGVNMEWL